MKTKIIYISGNELFDMADIRAAFDEVRTALALDDKTILFGVPVDNDDAFVKNNEHNEPVADAVVKTLEPLLSETDSTVEVAEPEIAPEPIVVAPISEEKPEKQKKSSRKKVTPIVPIVDESEQSNVSDDVKPTAETPVIPILSVLETNSESTDTIDSNDKETAQETIEEPTDTTEVAIDTQSVTISDMIADDTTPVAEHEKTLEELLESMAPLGESEVPDQPTPVVDNLSEPEPDNTNITDDDTDATLELLATEFAESADKIVTPKAETRGKIGKLKNILPFKKTKRDDSGLMGDLFGWAGVANDEDFTIPGFFANATKK